MPITISLPKSLDDCVPGSACIGMLDFINVRSNKYWLSKKGDLTPDIGFAVLRSITSAIAFQAIALVGSLYNAIFALGKAAFACREEEPGEKMSKLYNHAIHHLRYAVFDFTCMLGYPVLVLGYAVDPLKLAATMKDWDAYIGSRFPSEYRLA